MKTNFRSLVAVAVCAIATTWSSLSYAQVPLRITTFTGDDVSPAWNPTNETVAYLRSHFVGGFPYDIFQTQSSPGFPELPLFVGPSVDLGPAFSPAWIGFTDFLACYESISIPEYLFINTALGPATRTIPDGAESTFFPAVFADAGNSGGYIRLSRDGSTMIVREIDFFGNARLRSASIFEVLFSSLLPLPLSSFGVVQLEAIPGSDNFFDQGVALSPDGSLFIASIPIFGSNSPHDLWLFSTDASTTPINLTNSAAFGVWNVTPDIAPDGTGIVFARWSGLPNDSFDLYGIDLDGTMTQLTNTPFFNEYGPSWAPDGLRIAYQGAHFAGFESSFPALTPGEGANWNIYTLQVRELRTVAPTLVPNLPVVATQGRKATIRGERFGGVTLSRRRSSLARDLQSIQLARGNRPGTRNVAFEYNYTLERIKDALGQTVRKDIRRKTSKRNTVTYSRLPPGTYRASYRMRIDKKSDTTPSRTAFSRTSPRSTFQVR